MDLHDYIRVLRKRWKIVVAITVAGLVAAFTVSALTTPTYRASTQFFISTSQSGADTNELLQGNNFTQQRVKSYADIVKSRRVLQPVVERLGLQMTAKQLAGSVTAEAPLDTVLINVTVTDTSPAQAQRIANAIGQQFGRSITELERPTAGGSTPVKVSVVEPADLPSAPASPRKRLNLLIGLGLGLGLGISAAALRDVLDTTIKSEADVKAVTTAPLLGGISYDLEAAGRPLIVHSEPHSLRAEAFRQLRTNLQFVDLGNQPRSIAVTSSVPGEGKSTTSVSLAVTLAATGSRVALVEGDLRRPKVAEYLGLEDAAGLTNVLIGQTELDEVLQPCAVPGLVVLACGPVPPNPSELLGSMAMNDVLRTLEAHFDYVILDCPPLLPVTDAAVVSHLTGGAVVVVASGKINRDELRRAIATLESVDARVLGWILNFRPTRGPDSYGDYAYGYGYSSSEGSGEPASDEHRPALSRARRGWRQLTSSSR